MQFDEYIPTLTHATERDIDLIIVEELHSSFYFLKWVAAHAGILKPIASWDVKHSKRRTKSRREIDIFIEIQHRDETRSAILIENKLDANEQPDQAESYREELGALTSNYGCAAMLIMCPASYSKEFPIFTEKFDAILSYEEIVEFFRHERDEAGSDLIMRYGFRAELIEQAIHKHRRGWSPVPDRVVGDFNARYVQLLAQRAPEIKPGASMLKPAPPSDSVSMIFDQDKTLADLPTELRPRRFAHEFGRGKEHRANYVAVTFGGWGSFLPSIRQQLETDTREIGAFFLSKTPNKNRPNPGLVMAIPTDPVDNQRDFDSQLEQLETGIAKAALLRQWLLSNRSKIQQWRDLIDTNRSEAS